jgi:hypothetical protein
MNRVKLFLLNEMFASGSVPDVQRWFSEYIYKKCIFVGYGKAGKSGPSMVYFFKQSHDLEQIKYAEMFEFLHTSQDFTSIERVFLLDDFLGSGEQAITTWFKSIEGTSFEDISKKYPHLKFTYLVLLGFKDGIRALEESTPLKVIFGEELDERFKCFSNVSVIYEDSGEREKAREVMEQKGRILYRDYPLGYDDMELAVSFHHNTPDNSLPVIWKRMDDGTWYPLFERFE